MMKKCFSKLQKNNPIHLSIFILQKSCESSCGSSAVIRHHQRALHDRGTSAQREEIRTMVLLYAFPSIIPRAFHCNALLLFKRRGKAISLKKRRES